MIRTSTRQEFRPRVITIAAAALTDTDIACLVADSRLVEAPYADDTVTRTIEPISLSKWLKCCEEEIEILGRKALFDRSHFVTAVFIYGGDFKHLIETGNYETFFWQLVMSAVCLASQTKLLIILH